VDEKEAGGKGYRAEKREYRRLCEIKKKRKMRDGKGKRWRLRRKARYGS